MTTPTLRSVAEMDDAAIGRRVAAARKRAGIEQRKKLTDAADLPRVGPATLGKIERGERHLFPHEAEAFARVLGVDRGFFFEEDQDSAADVTERLAERLETIEAKLVARTEHDNVIAEMLERQTAILQQIEIALKLTLQNAGIIQDGERDEESAIPRYPRQRPEDQRPASEGQQ